MDPPPEDIYRKSINTANQLLQARNRQRNLARRDEAAPQRWEKTTARPLFRSRHWKHLRRSAKVYAVPAAGVTFAAPVLSFLPLGHLRPLLVCIAKSLSYSRLQQITAGNYHVFLHCLGLDTVLGQVVSLVGFMGMEIVFGPLGSTFQQYFLRYAFSIDGLTAPLIGLTASLVASVLGSTGLVSSTLMDVTARNPSSLTVTARQLRQYSIQALFRQSTSYLVYSLVSWIMRTPYIRWLCYVFKYRLEDVREFFRTARHEAVLVVEDLQHLCGLIGEKIGFVEEKVMSMHRYIRDMARSINKRRKHVAETAKAWVRVGIDTGRWVKEIGIVRPWRFIARKRRGSRLSQAQQRQVKSKKNDAWEMVSREGFVDDWVIVNGNDHQELV